MHEDVERVLIDEGVIEKRLDILAERVMREFRGRELMVVVILKGALVFTADLLRRLPIPLEIECLNVASYHGGTESSGQVDFLDAKLPPVEGRFVLVVDDILDLTANTQQLGKPSGNDLKLGLATAPILYAAEQRPELYAMIDRKFRAEGDIAAALQIVKDSDGVERSRQLAQGFADESVQALHCIPDSPAKATLVHLASRCVARKS